MSQLRLINPLQILNDINKEVEPELRFETAGNYIRMLNNKEIRIWSSLSQNINASDEEYETLISKIHKIRQESKQQIQISQPKKHINKFKNNSSIKLNPDKISKVDFLKIIHGMYKMRMFIDKDDGSWPDEGAERRWSPSHSWAIQGSPHLDTSRHILAASSRVREVPRSCER